VPSEGTEFNLTGKPQGFRTAIEELLRVRGLADPSEAIALSGKDPFYKTPFKVGETVSAVLTTIGVAANDLWELRHGRRQDLSVDVGHAAASLRTVDYTRKQKPDGQYAPVPPSNSMAQMLTVTQPWATKDGKWFLPHLNLPGLSKKVLSVLQCENTVEGVSSSVRRWNGEDLEQAIADAGACGGLIRTPAEWLAHPQGQYLSARPVIEIRKVREGAPKPLIDGTRPLDGIRSLDLTRILAGPIAGRTLGEHGADVLMVTAPHLPQVAEHVRDTSHGKRSCFLDFEVPEQAAVFRSLVQTADVVIDGYRPGALTRKGFGREQLFDLCPGLIHLSVSCFGSGGPFQGRQSAMFIRRRGLLDAFDTAPGSIADAVISSSGLVKKSQSMETR
jgi:crotonobetainyl-CoA:carnitine CoA-transferase CaiB-like acyl-CoA transferase